VRAGESLRVKKGEAPRRLLRAPDGLKPADGAHVNTTEIALAWDKVAGAAEYAVIVASDAKLANVVSRTPAAAPGLRVKLAPGTYYWAVQSVDADGQAGRRRAAQRLVVDTTPPALKTGKPKWR
jgi:hypothetical protein